MSQKRALFQPGLQELRDRLPSLIPTLEAREGWYGSVYFERKASKTFMANMRQTQVSDQATAGLVLRIYDGFTLHEQATDDLDYQALPELARRFAARVSQSRPPAGVQPRFYKPATWSERLAGRLDPEIVSQVPAGVSPETQVHFGIRYEQDPFTISTEAHLTHLKSLVGRCQELAVKCGISPTDLSYAMARLTIRDEESIFVDRESNLSQRLLRVALVMIAMSGAVSVEWKPQRSWMAI